MTMLQEQGGKGMDALKGLGQDIGQGGEQAADWMKGVGADVGQGGSDAMDAISGQLGNIGEGAGGHVDALMQMLSDPAMAGGAGGAAGAAGGAGLALLAKKLMGGKGKTKKAASLLDLSEVENGMFSRSLDHLGVPAANAAYIMGGKKAGLNLGLLSLVAAA